ncbi:hypothetical protein [Roseicitreum antarcticum]|uniref:DUF115 domain-containing protein n=1 Tax=Roseicitreum antarcticum TaxID=564137 RepID=A0A1H3CP64_9RHOB|nr:hypothetical protein [Roseicitreum antarcticum]SDX55895.1 hypothetical protein SAMN04488238_1106 [Roseicitreum antarcticum]
MIPFNKQLIFATRPLRYAFDSFTYKLSADTSVLQDLKDRNRGKPMLVVGNGPSLNQTPLDDFAHVPSVGMNKIDMLYPRTTWRPEVVVCLNNLVAKQNQDVFAASNIPTFVAWKARWYMRAESRRKLNFFNTTLSNAFATDALSGFGSSATVTYIALQMAYWMGADPVIIFGVDHSFKYTGPEATYQKREGPDTNHFDPNYFKSGTYWGTPDLDQSEIDYGLARQAFEADGRKVYDATIGGKLGIFEKISVAQAADLCGTR